MKTPSARLAASSRPCRPTTIGPNMLRRLRAKWEVAARTIETCANWPTVLALYGCARFTCHLGAHKEMQFHFRDGTRVFCLRGPLGSSPVFEVLISDVYRLANVAPLLPKPPAQIIDVGAYVGSAALAFARMWPDASITCVEPSPTSANLLRRNLAANRVRATVVEAAAGGATGTAILNELDQGSCESRVGTLPEGVEASVPGVRVPMVAMADVLALADLGDGPILVKLDCEGSEYEIVSGSPLSLWEHVAAVLMEYHPVTDRRLDELAQRLGEAGLALVWHKPGNRAGLGLACFAKPLKRVTHAPRTYAPR